MIRTALETERLRLRLFTDDDVQLMYELGSDPEIIRYMYKETLKSLDEARQRLEEGPLADYQKYGYGRFAVEIKETGRAIGFCGIKFIEKIGLPEVGYCYLKEYWGRGIGTEAARACVDFAREDLGCKKLVALIVPENGGSMNVARKLGMSKGPLIHIYGMDAYQFEMML